MVLQVKLIPLTILVVVLLVIIILGIHIVPKNKVYIIERLGVYYTTWQPGIHFLLFGVERVREKVPTNIQEISKNFDVISEFQSIHTFNITLSYKIKEPVNYAYRKDIVMLNLDEIIFDFLRDIASDSKSMTFDNDNINNQLLSKTQSHADLIDLQMLSVSINNIK